MTYRPGCRDFQIFFTHTSRESINLFSGITDCNSQFFKVSLNCVYPVYVWLGLQCLKKKKLSPLCFYFVFLLHFIHLKTARLRCCAISDNNAGHKHCHHSRTLSKPIMHWCICYNLSFIQAGWRGICSTDFFNQSGTILAEHVKKVNKQDFLKLITWFSTVRKFWLLSH